MTELLPCPFCGGKGRLYQRQNAAALWYVRCDNCDAGPSSDFGQSLAIRTWNKRHVCDPAAEIPTGFVSVELLNSERRISDGVRADNDRLRAQVEQTRTALLGMVEMYCDLVNSGDAGFWDPEEVIQVKAARTALAFTSTEQT